MIPKALNSILEAVLTEYTGEPVLLHSSHSVHGGCINHTDKLNTTAGNFFLKWGPEINFNNFLCEQKGLEILSAKSTFVIPEVLSVYKTPDFSFLLIAYIESSTKRGTFWEDLGTQLAILHQNSSPQFGLDSDNYIGSLPQLNTYCDTFSDFFIHCRIEPQLKMATDQGYIPPNLSQSFKHLYTSIPNILPEEAPSLIHGDLWSGNLMVSDQGAPVLIDPAVYFGHRESELAFTRLFGGFDHRMYQAYHAHFPLYSDWKERVGIFNLYPLLVHLNLFGLGYLGQIKEILKKF